MLLPKFLTKEVADQAIRVVIAGLWAIPEHEANVFGEDHNFSIVVLVPGFQQGHEPNVGDSLNRYLVPHQLTQQNFSVDQKEDWRHPFDEIAQSKALQLWQDRNDGGTDIKPHLLFASETRWWGGVKRDGMVVTCSGFKPHFDRMVSGMVADTCIAMAYHAWTVSDEYRQDEDFVRRR